jgi:two-component system CheB/CheR fusion protein
LQQTPVEVDALFRDLLIGVTHFFRDPEAFKVLEEQVIPKLFDGKSAGTGVRVWAPGCSTGEEAYSIAILLQERLEALQQHVKVQVFATDIDVRPSKGRAGFYPASRRCLAERLARFSPGPGAATRIQKAIRDLLVFRAGRIKDPPFSA